MFHAKLPSQSVYPGARGQPLQTRRGRRSIAEKFGIQTTIPELSNFLAAQFLIVLHIKQAVSVHFALVRACVIRGFHSEV
jgi:hypothetical protein